MDELILRRLRGTATEFEEHQLQRWLEASASNRRRFEEARELYVSMSVAEPGSVGPPPAVDVIVRAAEARRRRGEVRAGRRTLARSAWFRTGLAAAAVLATLLIVRPGDAPDAPLSRLTPIESSMGEGEVNTMTLSDGSVIRAAPSTRLEFPPAAGRREVVLEGRAFFAVAAHGSPFVVRTRAGSATVLGTRFEIAMASDELRLVVIEGSVRLEGEAGAADVHAGHVAWLSRGAAPRVVARDDVWQLLDWRSGLMIFQETPLARVAQEIGRQFGYEVRVLSDDLGRRRVTAWFDDETVDEVVSAVCLIAGARCNLTGNQVTIRP